MVKLPILLGLICFASINQTAFSEGASTQDLNLPALIVSDTEPQVKCNGMVYDDQKQESTYIGNVFLKTGKFEASDAAKAVYNHTTKKITVYDCKEFSFTEKLVMKPGKKLNYTIEYVLGDNKAILF